ncbi:hypothetical protein BJY52DRAFT_1332982 [Lactarius psammicola]|nr:hypothetical protein BJY52DRAFT_1332982 [Lactarius psammicola]
MDAREAHENLKINGGDDIDNEVPLEQCPTRVDFLKVTDDINNPLACKLEAVLGSFSRLLQLDEAQNMKETVITDYFSKC